MALCYVMGFHRQLVAMSRSFVAEMWIYAGQATQLMANGDINCGQSMQEWFLIVAGCHALGFH